MSVTSDKVIKDDIVNIEVDGQALKAHRGQMLIEAADRAGIIIPRFCYHNKLSVAANCRMCLVEVEKVPKPLPACATPVTEGMKVYTRSPRALEAQRGTMEFLLINHPLDCPICDQGGECDLQEISIGFGNDHSRFVEGKRVVPDKDIGPLISTEMTRCIHCTRCVRFGDEIAGVRELGATGRGENTRIGTYIEKSVSSELSGNVIDLCPVGALTSKPFRFTARAWEMSAQDSIAPHDCVGSNLSIKLRDHEVMRVDPRDNESVNECWIADRDRFSYEALNGHDRLQQPMIRENGQWRTTDWSTALEFTVKNLQGIIKQHGAAQLGALTSPSSTVEEFYLLQKLLRALGSHNIDHRLRQQDFTDQDLDPLYPWISQSFEDLEKVDCALLIGANLRKDQPMLNHRLRKAALAGARVMAINHIAYEFNYRLHEQLVARPGDQIEMLKAIIKAVSEKQGTAIPEDLKQRLADVTVSGECTRIAESLLNSENGTVLVGVQALMHRDYALLRALAGTLADLCSMRLGFVSFGANAAGAYIAGAVPHRGKGGEIPAETGLSADEMIASPLKAYILHNIEPEYDCADALAATNSLLDAEFVVSLSPYSSKMIEKYANVILPTAAFTETSGTYINAQGDWQSFQGVAAPKGEARPAWKVLRVLGNLFDVDGFDYVSSDEILEELRSTVADKKPENMVAWRYPQASDTVHDIVRIADVPIYAVDNIVRRAGSLQETEDACAAAVYMNEHEAGRLGLVEGARVHVSQAGDESDLAVKLDERIADGCVYVPSGVAGTENLGGHGRAIRITRVNH